jgi:hypothetical protein
MMRQAISAPTINGLKSENPQRVGEAPETANPERPAFRAGRGCKRKGKTSRQCRSSFGHLPTGPAADWGRHPRLAFPGLRHPPALKRPSASTEPETLDRQSLAPHRSAPPWLNGPRGRRGISPRKFGAATVTLGTKPRPRRQRPGTRAHPPARRQGNRRAKLLEFVRRRTGTVLSRASDTLVKDTFPAFSHNDGGARPPRRSPSFPVDLAGGEG